jgi:hypothetical protein
MIGGQDEEIIRAHRRLNFRQAGTDTNGHYQFGSLAGAVYRIRASKSGYTLTPGSRDVSLETYSVSDINFTATPQGTIQGTVTNNSAQAMSGVTVKLSGTETRTTTTNSSGQYSFTSLTGGGNYLVTPQQTGYNFSALEQSLTNVTSTRTANFTGTAVPLMPVFSKHINYSYNQSGALTGVGTDWIGSDPNATGNVVSGMTYRPTHK